MSPRLSAFPLGLLLLAGCTQPEPAVATADGPALPVHVATVALEKLPVVLEVPATVRPAERAIIAD
ncbi:MAG: hypothetical protein ABUL61_04655, partial [Oleiharenicola lentus]